MKFSSFLLGVALITVSASPLMAMEEEAWQQMNEEVFRFYSAGDAENALRFAEEALKFSKVHFGLEHLNTAKSMNNLANLYFYSGRIDEAEWMYEDAMRIEETLLGPESAAVADTLFNHGILLLYRKENDRARLKFERAAAIHRGMENPDEAAIRRIEEILQGLQSRTEEVPL